MPETPFLQRVALYYANTPPAQLVNHIFVFPNKRSATFFRHFLLNCLPKGQPYIEPGYQDFGTFVRHYSELVEPTRYEALLSLYNCYRELIHERRADEEVSFEKFVFWGDMLLSDFNDVDRYLVDPDALFTNVTRLREIGSEYLTPEQIEIIRRYWGADEDSVADATTVRERFWKHLDNPKSHAKRRFLRLWEILGPLYHRFTDALTSDGLILPGRLYRLAAERAATPAFDDPTTRFVFIGFNVLTTSELKIFKRLKATGNASFFWDFNSPALRETTNKAGRFIIKNIEDFPSPPDFDEPIINTFPDIKIIGVPSNVGQAKMAASIISDWHKKGYLNTPDGLIDTAVVLPDEALFIPLSHCIPPEIKEMNVTMGFPMRLSPVAALFNNIRQLQRNARRVDGHPVSYFFEDVRSIISMPFVQALAPDEVQSVNLKIRENHLFQIEVGALKSWAPTLAPLLAPLYRHATTEECADYLTSIISYIRSLLDPGDKAQIRFVESYAESLAELMAAAKYYDVRMEAPTFLSLVSRAVRGDSISFSGEPLRGLQIMGVLETRALDFSNLIMTSMNERIFPRKSASRSFIPDIIRRAFGMATADFQESIFAYYFYRLISRASHVALIYDSRSVGGVRSNEMSRYLTQLLYLFPEANARHIAATLGLPHHPQLPTTIEKTPAIMEKIQRFATPGSGYNISASSFNTFINCPLQFYLSYVERFSPDDDIVDYVDASTYGSIVHYVMEKIYTEGQSATLPLTVTEDLINRLVDTSNTLIDTLVARAINKFFFRIKDPADYRPLTGETLVISRVIHAHIVALLNAERQLTPFRLEATEDLLQMQLEVTPELKVNVKQIIDRIDRIPDPLIPGETLLRIVDYKTGGDKTSFTSLGALFDNRIADRRKAILQLLFYCSAYAADRGYPGPIKPVIYNMRNIAATGIDDLKMSRTPLNDHRLVADEFMTLFREKLLELFNPDIPFTTAPTDHSCTFCKFKMLCSRADTK